MNRDHVEDLLQQVCNRIHATGGEYVIVGGIAVLAYGTPRTTMDADIIIQMDNEALESFIDAMAENEFFASIDDATAALREHLHFTIEHKGTLFRLDLKGVYNEMDRRTIDRRRKVVFRGTSLYLESPEDLIANKLVFGSPQDLRDAESVYLRQRGLLDLEYLEFACTQNGVGHKWHHLCQKLDGEG